MWGGGRRGGGEREREARVRPNRSAHSPCLPPSPDGEMWIDVPPAVWVVCILYRIVCYIYTYNRRRSVRIWHTALIYIGRNLPCLALGKIQFLCKRLSVPESTGHDELTHVLGWHSRNSQEAGGRGVCRVIASTHTS